jgi:hypothetical protein
MIPTAKNKAIGAEIRFGIVPMKLETESMSKKIIFAIREQLALKQNT